MRANGLDRHCVTVYFGLTVLQSTRDSRWPLCRAMPNGNTVFRQNIPTTGRLTLAFAFSVHGIF